MTSNTNKSSYPRRNAVTQRFTLGAPRTIIVSRDGQRILFCRSTASDDPVNRLWVIDLPNQTPRLLVDPAALLGDDGMELTTEEKARRERAREAGGGIVTYTTHSDHGVVAFVLGGRLFRTDIDSGETIEIETNGVAHDPRFSPDAKLIAYHGAGELRVVSATNGSTGESRAVIGRASESVSWGAAEFVAAEEMGRNRGFWWSPNSDRLLVARVDTSSVTKWHISEPVSPATEPRALPYPAAGTTNAQVDLFIVGLDDDNPGEVGVDWQAGEFEYLARAEWTARNGIALTVQTRDQRSTAILTVDPTTGATTELVRMSDPGWSELVTGTPRRFGDHLVTVQDDHVTDTRHLMVDGQAVTPPGLQVRSVFHLGSNNALVGATTNSTELHVHRVSLDGAHAEQLSTGTGIHRAAAGGSTIVLTSLSMDDTRSRTTVMAADAAPFEIESFAERPDLDHMVTFHVTTERQLNSAVLVPSGHDGSPLPVLLDPYGGPHALRVQRARAAFSASQWIADQGFVVVVTDGAGTPARGPKFEQEILGNFADPVLDDQVAALHALAESHGELLDLERVGIRGWSFGGYLAALGVLKRPDVFHAGIAGAPVTDWRLYDTHYTERYLGHPDTDAQAYVRSDLIPLAADLERPLMLIHGLADDNVVAAHTFALSRALLEAGRAHQVLPLSGVSHMTPQESVAENMLHLQVSFLKTSLGIADRSNPTSH